MASLPNPRTVTYEEWLEMPIVDEGTEEVVDGQIIVIPPARRTCRNPDIAVFDRTTIMEENGYYHSAPLKPREFPHVQVDIDTIWPD